MVGVRRETGRRERQVYTIHNISSSKQSLQVRDGVTGVTVTPFIQKECWMRSNDNRSDRSLSDPCLLSFHTLNAKVIRLTFITR